MHRVSEEFLKSFFFIVSCFKHCVNLFKTIVNLFSYGKKQRISTLYENNHYIIPHIKKLLIFQCTFLFLPQDIHKKSYLFHKLKDMKSWYSENNYNLRNYSQAFLKALHCTCLTRFRVFLWFWVSRILNMSLVLKMQRLWVYQSSEYASVTQGNWICQNISGFVWICRNMPKYAWICRNIREYAEICVNMPKSVWRAFALRFPVSPFVLQSLPTWTRGYLFERLQDTRGYSLKEHEVVFLKRHNLICFEQLEVFNCFLF